MTESKVQITVRPAMQCIGGDLQVECPRTWTVLRLKEHLHEICPTHPEVSSQRLIYVGACLTDATTLEAVLARVVGAEGPQVFHLACPMPVQAPTAAAPELRQRKPTSANATATPPNTPQSAAGTADAATMEAWRQYYTNYMASMSSYSAAAASSSMAPQQQAAAYSAYYNYYMSQYMANMNSMGAQVANMAAAAPAMPVQQAPDVQNAGVVGAAPVGVAAVAAAPEPGERMDLLELVYRVFRIGFFLMLIFIYASIEKAIQVVAIALVLYFIQMIRQNPAQRQQARPRAAPRAEEAELNNNAADPAVGEAGAGAGAAPTDEDGDLLHPDETRGGTLSIFFSTCYSFITSFITSLVPDNPVPVNVN